MLRDAAGRAEAGPRPRRTYDAARRHGCRRHRYSCPRFDLGQYEEEALFAAIALLLALGGPGRFSADAAFCIRAFDRAWPRYLSIPVALAGAAFMLFAKKEFVVG